MLHAPPRARNWLSQLDPPQPAQQLQQAARHLLPTRPLMLASCWLWDVAAAGAVSAAGLAARRCRSLLRRLGFLRDSPSGGTRGEAAAVVPDSAAGEAAADCAVWLLEAAVWSAANSSCSCGCGAALGRRKRRKELRDLRFSVNDRGPLSSTPPASDCAAAAAAAGTTAMPLLLLWASSLLAAGCTAGISPLPALACGLRPERRARPSRLRRAPGSGEGDSGAIASSPAAGVAAV